MLETILSGGNPNGGTERTREGAMIVESAAVGDFRDGTIRFLQESRSGGQARLCDQLARGEAKDAPGEPFEARQRQAGTLRERGRRNGILVMTFQVLKGARQPHGNGLLVAQRPQVP